MRRFAELIAVAATAVILIATSQARSPCAVETRVFTAQTGCNPNSAATELVVSSTPNCLVGVIGADQAGLPRTGSIRGYGPDAGVLSGFHLTGVTPDGGNVRNCEITPADAGFDVLCVATCGAGKEPINLCESNCSGTLRLH